MTAAFDIRVCRTESLDEETRASVARLFRVSYRTPNDRYLDRSLARLRYLASAWREDRLAGFAVGETRIMDLPRLPRQVVALAGLCCIDPEFRRLGLFSELEVRAFAAAGVQARDRLLSCGRVTHPASFRTMTWSRHHVPKAGEPPTAWQREVGTRIAEAYGVEEFDPETFVCRGEGSAMSPIIDVDVDRAEWEVFREVNAARGDCLLGLLWTPDAPAGW